MSQLPKKAVFAKYPGIVISGVIGVIVGIFWLVLEVLFPRPVMTPLVPLGGVIFCLLVIVYSIFWVRLFGYQIKDTELKIAKGVISKSYDAIPYSHIQNVNLTRNLLERMLGISTVRVETAGANTGTEVVIPGVDANTADGIRAKISEKIHNNN